MHKKVSPDKLGGRNGATQGAERRPGSRAGQGSVKPEGARGSGPGGARGPARGAGAGAGRGRPAAIQDVLARANPVLAGIARRMQQQQDIAAWTRERLPPELLPHVTEVLEKEGVLTVFAESAAWAGRLRFAVEELRLELAPGHPHIKKLEVRVMPRMGASGPGGAAPGGGRNR